MQSIKMKIDITSKGIKSLNKILEYMRQDNLIDQNDYICIEKDIKTILYQTRLEKAKQIYAKSLREVKLYSEENLNFLIKEAIDNKSIYDIEIS